MGRRLVEALATRRIFALLLAIASGLVLLSARPAVAQAPTRWTVFIYMAADHDLEPYSIINLKQAELGLPAAGVEVIAFIDRAAGNNGSGGNWSGGRLYRVRSSQDPSRIGSELLTEYGRVASSDPAFLTKLTAEVFQRYPSEKRALILWDHGGGWATLLSDNDDPTAPGKSTGMTLTSSAKAIKDALARANLPKLDLLGLDMCLMAQMEAVLEYSDVARVLVASQAVEPGTGWAYDKFLPAFAEGAGDARQVGRRIVETFTAFNAENRNAVSTLAALDLDQAGALMARFDALLAAMKPNLTEGWADAAKSLFWAEGYATGGRLDDLRNRDYALSSIDILDALKRLEANLGDRFAAKIELAAFRAAATQMILISKASDYHAASNGLSLYAPVRPSNLSNDYQTTRFARETQWLPFLQQVHTLQATAARPPKVQSINFVNAVSNQPIVTQRFGDDAIARTEITGDNILFTKFQMARHDPQSGKRVVELRGLLYDTELAGARSGVVKDLAEFLAPRYTPAGAKMATDAAILSIVVISGTSFAQPTIDNTNIGSRGQVRAQARAYLERPGQPRANAIVLFNLSTSAAIAVMEQIVGPDGRLTPRDTRLGPNDRLIFLAEHVDDQGRVDLVEAGPPMPWGPIPPTLLLDLPRPGRYAFTVTAESIAGAISDSTAELDVAAPTDPVMARIMGGRALRLNNLVGDWKLGDGGFQWRVSPSARRNEVKVDWLNQANAKEQADAGLTMVAELDQRKMPTLLIKTFDRYGALIHSETNLIFADPANRNGFTLRSLVGQEGDPRGAIIPVTRLGLTPAPAPTPAVIPPATPPVVPPPAPPPQPMQPPNFPPQAPLQFSMVGYWRGQGADGAAIEAVFYQDGRFQQRSVYQNGARFEFAGRWALQGGMLAYQILQPNMSPAQQVPIQFFNNGLVVQTPYAAMSRVQ